MDTVMGIAATSISMNASQLQQNVSISVLKKAMNAQASQAADLIQTMQQTVQPAAAAPQRLLDKLV